jgi:carboxymethylenebutenolidase
MQLVDRRVVLGGLAAFSISHPTCAATAENLSVAADEESVALTRYAAHQTGKRAGIVVLHGSRGIELHPRAYQRYADALNAAGMDAYLAHYFTASDLQALDPKTSSSQGRKAYDTERFAGWAKRVSSVVTAILARPESSGRIGLLGFSLGGFIAAGAAARDDRIAALAVLYGGMPDAMAANTKRLPPLLELHGDADRNVPFAKGKELVKLANAVGSTAEQVTYPGKDHGFDFSDTDPATLDAIGRVTRFFQSRLASP